MRSCSDGSRANPRASIRDMPLKLQDIEEFEEAIAAYEEDTAPFIKYYENVYIPIQVSPRDGYKAELYKKLGLDY